MSALLKLRDYQTRSITAIHTEWDAGVRRPAVVLPTGAGKGHTLRTLVPTPKGLRYWGDLRAGDEIYGSDGQSTEVTAIYDRGILPAYRVSFSDGASVEVDGEHLWAIRDAQYRRTSRERRVVETRAIAASDLRMDRGYRWHIPMAGAVDRKPADLPIDPYVVGTLIANGTLGNVGTILTTPDREVAERVRRTETCNKINDATPGMCDRYSIPDLTRRTKALGMRVKSGEKRIPRIYLEGSTGQRIDLLHGLMDGDGSARDEARRSVNYSTTSPGLVDDVCELVTSLGGTANLKVADRSHHGKPVEYALGIVMPAGIAPFWSSRKAHAGTESIRNLQPRRAIVSIEPIGDRPIRCITVAAPDSLYLVTRHHIVTHNTVVFAHLAEQFLAANPGRRVLVLAHTNELIEQAAHKIRLVAPDRSIGIVKAERNEVHAEIVVGSVQSLRSEKRRAQVRRVGLIIVDECHHATARTYRDILTYFGAMNDLCPGCREASDQVSADAGERCWPSYCDTDGCVTGITQNGPVHVAGFTATLVRGDKAKLSDIWESVAFKLSIAFMIRSGYLLDVKGKRVEVPDLNLSKVKVSGGDYQEGALGEALEEAFAPEIVAKAYVEHAADRKGILFAPLVHTAYAFAEAFNAVGIVTEVVHGALPKEERRGVLARLRSGETQVVCNAMVLTEGFDEPTVSCVVVARPTKSAGLYQQMVGRGLRPDLTLAPDERGHALILDVTGVSRMHGLQALVDLTTRDDLPEDVDEDLSLLELEDLILDEPEEREEGSGAGEAETWYAGPAETREFDPLGRDSDRTWAKTPEGTYYLAAGVHGYVFLHDSVNGEPGTYDLVLAGKQVEPGQRYVRARLSEHLGLDFEMAVAWGEELAAELGGFGTKTLTAKKAKWRKEDATSGQAFRVRRVPGWGGGKIRTKRVNDDPAGDVEYYYVEETGERLTKGMASEIIDGHVAACVIDPLVRFVKGLNR